MKLSAALLSVSLLPGLLLGACASNGVSVPWTSDLLVVEKSGARLVLRDPANGALRRVYETGAGPHEVSISFDSRWAVIANYGGQEPGSTLTVCDLVAGSVVRTIDLGGAVRPHGLAFLTNKEGAQLVAVTAELRDQILVVDISTGQVVRTLAAGGELPHMLVASSDGKQLYVTCMKSGEVVQLDAVTGTVLARAATGAEPEGLALTPDGRELWVGNRASDELVVLDAANLAELARIPVGDMPIRVECTPDGRMVLCSNANSGDLSLVSRSTRKELRRLKLSPGADSGAPVGIEIEPGSRYAFVALTRLDQIAVVDLLAESVRERIEGGAEPDGMAWASGGRPFRSLDGRR
jgi:YVTN family beta-propeller protein